MKKVFALALLLVLSGCACHPTWFRSCGPVREGWGVSQTIVDGQMMVTIERLPPGEYEVSARRNGLSGEETLAKGTIRVSRRPSTRVEITLEPPMGGPMPRDAFVVVRQLDRNRTRLKKAGGD